MGGNVFTQKDYKSCRLPLEQYLVVEKQWVEFLTKNNIPVKTVLRVRDKDTFGDLDLVVGVSGKELFLSLLKDCDFNIQGVSQNNNVVSILENDFQIDFIFVNDITIEYAQLYYSYSDIHNLTGKLCKKLGFKHGQNGLEYVIRDHTLNSDNRIQDTIFLSNDPYKHLEILQLDVERYKRGFNCVEDMFDYVCSSPYFTPIIFQPSALTNKDRTRDLKRPNFKAFLEYLKRKY